MVMTRFITLAQLILTLTSYVVSEVDSLSEEDASNGEANLAKELETALFNIDYVRALQVTKQINNLTIIETVIQNVYNYTSLYDIDILLYLARDIGVGDAKKRSDILKTIYLIHKFKNDFGRLIDKKCPSNPKSHCEGLKLLYTIRTAVNSSLEFSNEIKKWLPEQDSHFVYVMPETYRRLVDDTSKKTSKRVETYVAPYGLVTDDFVELYDTKEDILFGKYEVILNETEYTPKTKCYVRISTAQYDIYVKYQISDEIKNHYQNDSTTDEIVNGVIQQLLNGNYGAFQQYINANNVYMQRKVIYEFYKSTYDINKLFELSDHVSGSADIYTAFYMLTLETGEHQTCELLKVITKLESILDKNFQNSSNNQPIVELLQRAKTRFKRLQNDLFNDFINKTLSKFLTNEDIKRKFRIVNVEPNGFKVYDVEDSSELFYFGHFIDYHGNNLKSMYCHTRLTVKQENFYFNHWITYLTLNDIKRPPHLVNLACEFGTLSGDQKCP